MKAMTPLDSVFLRLEDAHTSLHIASVGVFDGPAPRFEQITDLFQRKLPLIPRYRQLVHEPAWHLGLPSWSDDRRFDLGYHLRRTALPRPGGSAELDALVSRLMSQRLDRDRPLWECWVVEGLDGGRWAMVNKVHHCMVDGVAGTDLLSTVLDTSPDPDTTAVVAGEVAGRPEGPALPGVARLACDVAGRLVHPWDVVRGVAAGARGAVRFAGLARPASASSLVGGLGSARTWTGARIDLGDVRAVRECLGGTVNDVVLAAVTRGFRDLLLARGEEPTAHILRTLVPISVRAADGRGSYDNRISAMVPELPVELPDSIERFRAVQDRLLRAKRSGERQAGELLGGLALLLPAPVVAATLNAVFRLPQRFLVTVATNVPGPNEPLYAEGRRLRELYPYVPIADRLRIGVAVLSYVDALYVGVTADRASTPDVDVLISGIVDEVTDLRAVSRSGV
jgi:diacylglycerol O-acyltransferase / wax synthase